MEYPIQLDWSGLGSWGDLITEPAPPALLEYLQTLDHVILGAATTPYASQALSGDFQTSDGAGDWYWAQVIGPAVYAMRGTFARSSDTPINLSSGTANQQEPTESYSSSGNRIDTPSPIADGNDRWPPRNGQVQFTHQADIEDVAGATGDDRVFTINSGTAVLTGPIVETFHGVNLYSFSGEVRQKRTLTSL